MNEQGKDIYDCSYQRASNASSLWNFVFTNDTDRNLLGEDDYQQALEDDNYSDEEDGCFVLTQPTQFVPGFKASRRSGKPKTYPRLGIGNYKGDSLLDERTRHLVRKLITMNNTLSVESLAHSGKGFNLYFGRAIMLISWKQERKVTLKIFKSPEPIRAGMGKLKRDVQPKMNSIEHQIDNLAEREFNNLIKARESYARIPDAYTARGNIVVMEFIGSNEGVPAPSVKTAALKEWELVQAYTDVLLSMRQLYQKARLVHGNLGESTLLFHKSCDCAFHYGKVYLVNFAHAIDRSQPGHAAALERDIKSVQKLFESIGLPRSDPTTHIISLWDSDSIRAFVTMEKYPDVDKLLRGCCVYGSNHLRRYFFARGRESRCFLQNDAE